MDFYTTKYLAKLNQINVSNIQQTQCPLKTIIDKL